jgi:NADPH:quinone reductase-like Zn-dependent oxidoreductase
MEAAAYEAYGPLENLAIRRVPIPKLEPGCVLVRVHAAALHVGDCFAVRGAPFPIRLETGLLRPSPGIPGFDFAGQVEAVGSRVTRYRPGDAVFGTGHGTCAEYAVANQAHVVPKPANLTFEQAAAVPTSALAALHALRDAVKLRPGQSCLINGAAGGVGTFAVQIAKLLGAEVTGVCSAANVDLVHELGAHHVIDYGQKDFTKSPARYDVIFDNIENRPLADCRRALKPHGTLILNSGTGASGWKFMTRLLRPLFLSPFVTQKLRRYLSGPNQSDLNALKELLEGAKLTPVIDRVFPLSETASALQYIETGRAHGKVVVKIPRVYTLVRPFARP